MRHSKRLKSLTMSCAVVASLLALAACGSSGKSDASSSASTTTTAVHTTDTLSKADYVTQANVVCGGLRPAITTWNTADDAARAAKDTKAQDDLRRTLVAQLADFRAKAAALNPPSDAE